MMMIWGDGQVPLNRVTCISQIVIPWWLLMRSFCFLLMQAAPLLLSFHGSAAGFSRMLLGHARYMKAEFSIWISRGRIVREESRRSGKIWTFYHCK